MSSGPPRLLPPRLPQGGVIGIVAPSSPVLPEALERGVDALRARGYSVRVAAHVFDRRGHLAGEDRDRAADLEEFFSDPEIHAVWCARGGSGSLRLLSMLDWGCIREHPKPFIGYSDITSLHLGIDRECGLATLFGPMVSSDLSKGMRSQDWDWLLRLISEPVAAGTYHDDRCDAAETLVGGRAMGRAVGGTLALLAATLGTRWAPDLHDSVLFLEDIHESPARVERFLCQLRDSGMLEPVHGILLGGFPCTASDEERAGYLSVEQVVLDVLGPLNKPLVLGWPLGHLPSPVTIPQGIRVELDADHRTLTVLEPAVR